MVTAMAPVIGYDAAARDCETEPDGPHGSRRSRPRGVLPLCRHSRAYRSHAHYRARSRDAGGKLLNAGFA